MTFAYCSTDLLFIYGLVQVEISNNCYYSNLGDIRCQHSVDHDSIA
jgi:hypothetical protein